MRLLSSETGSVTYPHLTLKSYYCVPLPPSLLPTEHFSFPLTPPLVIIVHGGLLLAMSHAQQHYTVPIGGAPFVHPQLSQLSNSPPHYHSAVAASTSSSFSSSSPSSSSSLASSPSSGRGAGSSGSPTSSYWAEGQHHDASVPPTAHEAAVLYSRQLHRHTAFMWESERLNIEKARLEGRDSPSSKSTKAGGSGGAPLHHRQEPANAGVSGSKTWDFLLGRSRSRKETGGARSGAGHKRNASLS